MRFLFLIGLILAIITSSCGSKKTQDETGSNDTIAPALAMLNKQIEENPEVDSLYKLRAAWYMGSNQLDLAMNDISKAIQLNPDVTEYHIILGDIYLAMGNVDASRKTLIKAFDMDPRNPEPALKLAELNLFMKDYEKTYVYIAKALEIDPNNARAYFMKGFARLEQQDTMKAIVDLQKATELNAEYYEAFINLGLLFSAKHDPLAENYLKTSVNLRPTSIEARYALGLFYQENDKFAEAIGQYDAILSMDPSFKFAHYNTGYIYLVYIEDYDKAIPCFNKAIDIDPSYAEAYYNRGLAYELSGKTDYAIRDYKQALKLKTNYEKAIEGLNRIEK